MKASASSSVFAFRKLLTGLGISFLLLASFAVLIPVHATPPVLVVGSPTQIATAVIPDTTASLTQGMSDSCYTAGAWFVVWGSLVSAGAVTWSYSFSTDGVTWAGGGALMTSTATLNGTNAFWAAACNDNTLVLAYDTTSGKARPHFNTFNVAVPASPVKNFGSDQIVTGYTPVHATNNMYMSVDGSANWILTVPDFPNIRIIYNSVFSYTSAQGMTNGGDSAYPIPYLSPNYLMDSIGVGSGGATTKTVQEIQPNAYPLSSRESGQPAQNTATGISGGICASAADTCTLVAAGTASSQLQGACYLEVFSTIGRAFTESTGVATFPTGACGYGSQATTSIHASGFVQTFSNSNIWMLWSNAGASSHGFSWAASNDGGATWGEADYSSVVSGTTAVAISTSGIINNNGQLQMLVVEKDSSIGPGLGSNVWIQLVTLGNMNNTSSNGQITIGSCPTKNTATFTMANSTLYYYQGTTLGQTTVTDLDTFVASDTQAANSQILWLALYVGSPGNPVVSLTNPMGRVAQQSVALIAGIKNVPFAVSIAQAIIPANTAFAVAVMGTDKIKINQSAFSGLLHVTGVGNPPSAINSNVADSNKIYLCMHAAFQTVLTTTTTQTVTNNSTTTLSGGTATTTTTSTFTVTTFNLSQGANTLPQLLLAIIVIFGPALLIAGITRSLWGGIMGVTLGVVVGVFVGIVPFWAVAVLIFMVVAVLIFAARSSSGGGGVS